MDGPPRRQRIALAATMFLITGVFGFLQPFVPIYLDEAGLSREQIGWLTALATGAALLIQPVLGRLSDRFDTRRPFMVFAALCAATAYLLYRYADGFFTFLFLSALGINGFQYLNAVGGVLIGRMVQAAGGSALRGGTTYVRYRLWGSVGYIIVAITTGLLVKQSLPQGVEITRAHLDPIFLYGPLMFLLIAVMALFVPDVKSRAVALQTSSPATDTETPATTTAAAPLPDLSDALPSPHSGLRWFLLSYFLYQFGLYGASPYLL